MSANTNNFLSLAQESKVLSVIKTENGGYLFVIRTGTDWVRAIVLSQTNSMGTIWYLCLEAKDTNISNDISTLTSAVLDLLGVSVTLPYQQFDLAKLSDDDRTMSVDLNKELYDLSRLLPLDLNDLKGALKGSAIHKGSYVYQEVSTSFSITLPTLDEVEEVALPANLVELRDRNETLVTSKGFAIYNPEVQSYLNLFTSSIISNGALLGPAGTGKTVLCQIMASVLKAPLVHVTCSANMTEQEFFGGYVPKTDGGFEFKDSTFIQGMMHGAVCFLDEVNLAPANVLGRMNNLLDSSSAFYTDDGRIIKRHPSSILMIAYNPGYQGTGALNEAFLNRFSGGTYCFPELTEADFEIRCKTKYGINSKPFVQELFKLYTAFKNAAINNSDPGVVSWRNVDSFLRILSTVKDRTGYDFAIKSSFVAPCLFESSHEEIQSRLKSYKSIIDPLWDLYNATLASTSKKKSKVTGFSFEDNMTEVATEGSGISIDEIFANAQARVGK